jgi:F0F1-type ATP synthase delta subunit
MTTSTNDIARAAVDAAVAFLRAEGRDSEIGMLPDAFARACTEHVGAVTVTLLTPTGDAGDLRASVVDALTKKLKKPVQLIERADPSILGGAVIVYGDERIDLSVRGGLQRFATSLVSH